jgi:hypothetical protein
MLAVDLSMFSGAAVWGVFQRPDGPSGRARHQPGFAKVVVAASLY